MPIPSALTSMNFDVRWTGLRRITRLHAPLCWQRWLTDRASLTQHLISASNGKFRVEVVRQGWARPTRSEALALGIPLRQLALIREVHLLGNDQVWVYARSIIPASTMTGRERQLSHVGNRSLGSILFSDPTMHRGPLQISRLQLSNQQTVWARRSKFFLSGKPLLVCEVFLPALEQVHYTP
ncbi:MAG: chorismate--pyruvate lyase family protein [Pseudomonadales bacterium]